MRMRQTRLLSALVALVAFAVQAGPREDRAFWVDTMLKIVSPVVTNLAAGTLHANLPKRAGNYTAPYSGLEAFGRVMTGFAPWFELPDDETPEGRLRAHWRPLLLKAVRNAVALALYYFNTRLAPDLFRYIVGKSHAVDGERAAG